MMKALNLFTLACIEDEECYTPYYSSMSGNIKAQPFKKHEIDSLRIFVDCVLKNGVEVNDLDNCFYGFEIPQIGKEFDILKISESYILNIELKSHIEDLSKIKQQLLKNKFYLRHLSQEKNLFTFNAEDSKLYFLTSNDDLKIMPIDVLCPLFKKIKNPIFENIEKEFGVSLFLVSPLNTPDRFLQGEYFLTLQQQEIKKEILKMISKHSENYIKIVGEPGTGKTLLLYDLALTLSKTEKVCIVHCGKLSEGHLTIQQHCENITIFPASRFRYTTDITPFKYIFVDETQRFRKGQYVELFNEIEKNKKTVIFSLDSQQVLTKQEKKNNIENEIDCIPCVKKFKLSEKVRSNEELAAFIRGVMDLNKANKNYSYQNVDIVFAKSISDAHTFMQLYKNKGFTFINHTPSQYHPAILDNFSTEYVAHRVIGQEFDKVMVMIDKNFAYDENKQLAAYEHPNPDYLYAKLLFQEMTRVREKLCIIVIDNLPVFKAILKIKQS